MDRLLRVPEVVRILGVKEATVRRWILQRKIPTVRIGKSVGIPEREIERLIREGTRPAEGREP